MTIPTQLMLEALFADPQRERHGLEIGEAAGPRSGTVHPIRARLAAYGWLASRWEDIDATAEGRPLRRDYTLTPVRAQVARTALARAYRPSAVRGLRPQPGQA